MSKNMDLELLRSLEQAVANLPWLQRTVLLAHRVDGLSYKEIAFLFGLSERYIESQMARAIAKLSKQLDGEELSLWERMF